MSARSFVTGIASICFVLLGTSWAAAELVNGSFEDPVLAANAYSTGTPTGWNLTGSMVSEIDNGTAASDSYGAIPDGQQVWSTRNGSLWQNTGIALQTGWTYTLNLMASDWSLNAAGASLLAADDSVSQGTAFATTSVATVHQVWNAYGVSSAYTGAAGKYLSVMVGHETGGWNAYDALSVSVTPAPEPSTVALTVSGLIGLLCYAWRKRK